MNLPALISFMMNPSDGIKQIPELAPPDRRHVSLQEAIRRQAQEEIGPDPIPNEHDLMIKRKYGLLDLPVARDNGHMLHQYTDGRKSA